MLWQPNIKPSETLSFISLSEAALISLISSAGLLKFMNEMSSSCLRLLFEKLFQEYI